MKTRTFYLLLTVIVALGVLSTAVLVLWTVYLHNTCSILTFIANEGGWIG